MTASLPDSVQQVFESFVTTEFTTIDSHGQPITWPVTPYYRPGGECIDVTTGLGYPKKANDAGANPKVALLFSEPTGSGMHEPPMVLVQGTARIDDDDLVANRERYQREAVEKLPGTKDALPPKFLQGWFDWYFTRLYIKVRPERVFVWPGGSLDVEPTVHDAHLEEVRSGHVEEPLEDHGEATQGAPAWDKRMEFVVEHDTGVLSWMGPDGFPLAVRVPFTAKESSKEISIDVEPAGLPLLEGRACLAVHRHAPDFSWQRNMQVRGNLARSGDGWKLVPRRIVGGFELPEGRLTRFRDFVKKGPGFYRTYRRRLRGRN